MQEERQYLLVWEENKEGGIQTFDVYQSEEEAYRAYEEEVRFGNAFDTVAQIYEVPILPLAVLSVGIIKS